MRRTQHSTNVEEGGGGKDITDQKTQPATNAEEGSKDETGQRIRRDKG